MTQKKIIQVDLFLVPILNPPWRVRWERWVPP
jgi:hypothetical protein